MRTDFLVQNILKTWHQVWKFKKLDICNIYNKNKKIIFIFFYVIFLNKYIIRAVKLYEKLY